MARLILSAWSIGKILLCVCVVHVAAVPRPRMASSRDLLSTDQTRLGRMNLGRRLNTRKKSIKRRHTNCTLESGAKECDNIWCGLGRECQVQGRKPLCLCAKSCATKKSIICGNDGRTYENLCEMNRQACFKIRTVEKLHDGPCYIPRSERKLSLPMTKPFVCEQVDAETIRQVLVTWIENHMVKGSWFTKGKSRSEVLVDTFVSCDLNKKMLVTYEQLKTCQGAPFNQNYHGLAQLPSAVRGLCLETLWHVVDTDANEAISFDEFMTLFSSTFSLKDKQCHLEKEVYIDGHEIRDKCKICVCSFGNWVCSPSFCKELPGYRYRYGQRYDIFDGVDSQTPNPSKIPHLENSSIKPEVTGVKRSHEEVDIMEGTLHNDNTDGKINDMESELLMPKALRF